MKAAITALDGIYKAQKEESFKNDIETLEIIKSKYLGTQR